MSSTLERPTKVQPPERPTAGGAASIKRHAVGIYYVLTFTISWGAILLAVGTDGIFGTGASIAVAGAASLLGPCVAGLLMTALVDGRAGFHRLASRLLRWRVGARWYAVALLTAPLVMAVTQLGQSVASPEFRPDILTAHDKLGILLIGLSTALVVPVFEELGWTGFALPKLRRRLGVFTTGVVMGLLWSAWHFPLFAGTTDPTGAVPAGLFVGALLFAWLPPYRILMVWVYERTESLLVVMLMHAPIVLAQYVLAIDGATGTDVLTRVLLWGGGFWLIVGFVARANRGQLNRDDVAGREAVPFEAERSNAQKRMPGDMGTV